jgi:hypothetical protein
MIFGVWGNEMKTWLTQKYTIPRWLALLVIALTAVSCIVTQVAMYDLYVALNSAEAEIWSLKHFEGQGVEINHIIIDRVDIITDYLQYLFAVREMQVGLLCGLGVIGSVGYLFQHRLPSNECGQDI